MRMKRQREAVQRNFPNSRSRVHLAKLLAITVFQVREANRYSGLRSLHVVHGDEASAFIIALFPSKALHCRERGGGDRGGDRPLKRPTVSAIPLTTRPREKKMLATF